MDWGEWSVLRPGRFTPWETGTHWIGGWCASEPVWTFWTRENILLPPEFEPRVVTGRSLVTIPITLFRLDSTFKTILLMQLHVKSGITKARQSPNTFSYDGPLHMIPPGVRLPKVEQEWQCTRNVTLWLFSCNVYSSSAIVTARYQVTRSESFYGYLMSPETVKRI
jgi:hypothetical protein